MTETADEARRRLVLAALILPVLCAAPVVPEEGPLHDDDADEDSDVNHGFDERAGDRGDDRSAEH